MNHIKCKNMMYEQQLKYLPTSSMENLFDCIKDKIQPEKVAVVLHDKDINKDGNPVEAHIHAMMSFKNARSINHIANLLNDKPEQIEAWKGNSNNGYAYLTHRTKDSMSKHQYNPDDVLANFDYPKKLIEITTEVSKANKKTDTSVYLDALYNGNLSKAEVEKALTGTQYGRLYRQINEIHNKRLENQARDFKQQMIDEGRQLQVVWIFGKSGTGKTSLAKDYAIKAGNKYYMSGSSKDVFQNYEGEHTIILDELRPKYIPYPDLLRILDPFNVEANAPSRYHDKSLAADLIIITTVYSPCEFYKKIFSNENRLISDNIDSFYQLDRRISLNIYMDNHSINLVKYNPENDNYMNLSPRVVRANPYSSINRPKQTIKSVDLFNSMFSDEVKKIED